MRIPRVFTEMSLSANCEVLLEPEVSHYLSNVLRLKPGRALVVFNGSGGEYPAEVIEAGKKQVRIHLQNHSPDHAVSPLYIELAIAVSRGERFDWVVQKATELGVTTLQPLWSERVEVRLKGPRLDKKLEHWRRISISASEQSGRTRLPELAPPIQLEEYLQRPSGISRLLLHPAEPGALDGLQATDSISLLVGPEGGWSGPEVTAALSAGFQPWQLGPRVLRTETAPVAALAILQHRFGDG